MGIILKSQGLKFRAGFNKATEQKQRKIQSIVDSEVLKRCGPYVPLDTGMLRKAGTLGTVIGSGKIVYTAPYARRQYYENKGQGRHNASGKRGKLWFERMKAAQKDDILMKAKAACK